MERSLELALNQEWPRIGATRKKMASVSARRIEKWNRNVEMSAIATVATDGGENRLRLEPMQMQVIRVADSRGEIYFEEFIPESLEAEQILRLFFKGEERLQKFMEYLELSWDELIPRSDLQRSQLVSMMRELMEWAALLKIASQPGPKLLIRDGLLRSILMSERVFERLREKFRRLTEKHGHLVVGVAKRSRVISYLSLALELTESLASGEPSFVTIPAELEREAAPAQYRWIGSRAMGGLNVARLDCGETAPLLPVDVAEWQIARIEEAMTLLHECSRGSFPMRGYPQPLVDAHEHARLGGVEIEMLEALLMEKIRERDPATADYARQLRLTGKQLAQQHAEENET